MTDDRRSSLPPVAPDRTSSAAVAERPEPDDARALDAQIAIPGVHADGDDAKLAGSHDDEYRAPEWA